MSKKSISIRRTSAIVALIVAAAAGGIVASYARAEGPTSVPMYTSSKTPATESALVSGFAPVVKRDQPAVVNISSSKVVRSQEGNYFGEMSPFFQQFFGGNFPGGAEVPRERLERSLGSGVIVSPDGYLITNNHVVDGASEIKVTLSDKREFDATVVGTDPNTDIAVLKIDARDLPTVSFADSSDVAVGDLVLALGNPFGVGQTVTMGIVSATGRANLGIEDYEDFIQTDAAINPGNSGGALVDSRGELIGINTAIISGGSGGNQGIGFAIPVNLARTVMDQLLANGKVTRGYIGVMLQEVDPDIASAFGLSEPTGALVSNVQPDGPAAGAGLEHGDILLSLNGDKIEDVNELRLKVSMMKPGTRVDLSVYRDGKQIEVPVTLGEMPTQFERASIDSVEESGDAMGGLSVDELTPAIARELRLSPSTRGVVVSSVDGASPAAKAGLERGDVIEEVNRNPVDGVSEFDQAMAANRGKSILLLVDRSGDTRYVLLEEG